MTATHTRKNRITAAIGAAIAGAAAPTLLFLGAGTAQAIQDISEHGGIATLDHLPTPRDCGSCGGFDPQPDPPGFPDPGSEVGVDNPNTRPSQTIDPNNPHAEAGPRVNGVNPNDAGVGNPNDGQIGGPDTKVRVGTPRGASPSLNPGDAVGIIIINS